MRPVNIAVRFVPVHLAVALALKSWTVRASEGVRSWASIASVLAPPDLAAGDSGRPLRIRCFPCSVLDLPMRVGTSGNIVTRSRVQMQQEGRAGGFNGHWQFNCQFFGTAGWEGCRLLWGGAAIKPRAQSGTDPATTGDLCEGPFT
ncbi:hypothetical protein BJV78DRAFT_1333860 [Lactifluus subvellereus]|nr:hypothetical protein BJV78DRAFT_1333860 [Lactifluus subvellereus]